LAGEVIAIGPKVTKWKIGDQVWGFTMSPGGKFGTIGEVMPLDTTKAIILPRKEGLKTTEAASIPLVFLTAYTALVYYAQLPGHPTGGQLKRILVLGGSTGVGIYALQIAAKRLGCHIVTTASSRNADFVRTLGANEVIDYTKTTVLKGALQHLPDGGYDAIIDLVGGMELLPHLNTLLKPEAAYVTIVGDKTSRNKLGGAAIYPFFPRMVLRSLAGYFGYSRKYYCINLHPKEEYLKGN
jgi:NADPH:quinone reductase-like Zn-dependent oxidoreductase